MDLFVSRKRRRISTGNEDESSPVKRQIQGQNRNHEEQTTDEKLAILSSIFEYKPYEALLDTLLACDGSVENAIDSLLLNDDHVVRNIEPSATPFASTTTKTTSTATLRKNSLSNSIIPGIQSSLPYAFTRPTISPTKSTSPSKADPTTTTGTSLSPTKSKPQSTSKPLTKRGRTFHLPPNPTLISQHTPCTLIHPFLPPHLASALLHELLPETPTFTSATFRLFDRPVKSPHTASFYVNSLAEADAQRASYLYNGSSLGDVREILPVMRQVAALVEQAVNDAIATRIETHYPHGRKLAQQAPADGRWKPNAAFVNCYDGPAQHVGWHTDQLTYLGPHPTIGSLSLGVQREFRIRRIVPKPDLSDPALTEAEKERLRAEVADAQGQISIPLPHNSLLVMHAEMQEGWKHSVAPAAGGVITPHSIAGGKRLNVTYRWYRAEFEPRFTPRCRCKEKDGKTSVPCVLKSVLRAHQNVGRHVWMCQAGGRVDLDGTEGMVGGESGKGNSNGCGYFEWAEFDDDGVPMWMSKKQELAGTAKDDGRLAQS